MRRASAAYLQACSYEVEGCWIWDGMSDGEGFASFRGRRAHRVMYEFVHGETLPQSDHIIQSCGNRTCINPEHLRRRYEEAVA
jgi:hypothetical protein